MLGRVCTQYARRAGGDAHATCPARARELLQLCSDTHIAPPAGVGSCLEAVNAPGGARRGAAADLLAKLVRMLAEVQVSKQPRMGKRRVAAVCRCRAA